MGTHVTASGINFSRGRTCNAKLISSGFWLLDNDEYESPSQLKPGFFNPAISRHASTKSTTQKWLCLGRGALCPPHRPAMGRRHAARVTAHTCNP